MWIASWLSGVHVDRDNEERRNDKADRSKISQQWKARSVENKKRLINDNINGNNIFQMNFNKKLHYSAFFILILATLTFFRGDSLKEGGTAVSAIGSIEAFRFIVAKYAF